MLHNFDEKPHEIKLNLRQAGEAALQDLIANKESVADERGDHHITLDAYGYRWFRAGNLGHLFS
jgi:maltose alpha-D-glucosyltransferase / alpha-amylase